MKKLTSFALLAMAFSFVSCEQRTEFKDNKTTLPETTTTTEARRTPQIIDIETEEVTPDEIEIEEDEFNVDDEDDSDQDFNNSRPVAPGTPTQINIRTTTPANRDELRQSWRDARDQLRESGRMNNLPQNGNPSTVNPSTGNPSNGMNPMNNASGNLRQTPPSQQRSSVNW